MVQIFEELKTLFNKNGYRLYMIGSTSRDYLLNNEIKDFDFVTDATPIEIASFLKVNMHFSKYGVVSLKKEGKHIDIATLREEAKYLDSRHPDKIIFIKDADIDYKRRDLTINAIYIDEDYKILPISQKGYEDLKNKKLNFIGDPLVRIKEDPLRILRAIRFIKEYNLTVNEEVKKILKDNFYLLDKINKDKINEEKRKLLKATGEDSYEF